MLAFMLAKELLTLPVRSAWIDGEVIMKDGERSTVVCIFAVGVQ